MGEGDDDNKESVNKYQDKMKDDNRKRYMKKKEDEMSEDEKKEEEAMRALNNGPTSDENRSCQDILCCLLFIAFLAGCVVVTALGFSQGNPDLITYVYDEDGNPCGKSGEAAADYPYLFLYNAVTQLNSLDTDLANQAICVKACPTNYNMTTLECLPTSNVPECKIEKANIFLSYAWLKKVCVPSLSLYDEAKKNTSAGNDEGNRTSTELDTEYNAVGGLINTKFINGDKLFDYLGDLVTVWEIFLACIGIAVVVGLVYLLIIRCCGCCFAYLVIFLILVLLAVLGYVFHKRMDHYDDLDDTTYKNIMLAFAIIFYALAFIWLLVILCSCNKIRLSIAITEIAARFVWDVWSILFVPLIMFVIVALYLAYWIALSVYIYSSGEVQKSSSTFLATVVWEDTTRYAWWFHLFALLWITAFFEALSSFVYSSTACIWYFEQGGNEKSVSAPVSRSFWRAFRYHLGSLAFGSLIIAIIRFIMVIVSYIRYQLETGTTGKNSKITKCYKCILDCCLCCLGCYEKCMEFINRHAYIQIALRGKNFCTSAFDGFAIVIRNLGRWSILGVIGGVFNLIGKLFIAALTGLIGYVIITEADTYNDELNSPILPTLIFVLIGYIIGSIFISIYGNASDALMHCFLVDCEINRDAQHSPPELRQFVEDERD